MNDIADIDKTFEFFLNCMLLNILINVKSACANFVKKCQSMMYDTVYDLKKS